MSLENKNFIPSKDIKTDDENLNHSVIIEKYKHEDIENLSPGAIFEFYDTEIKNLHKTTEKINTYLDAKEKLPIIAAQLSDLETNKPRQGVLIQEKIRELQDCERKINMFEKGKVPEDVLQNALYSIKLLEKKLNQYISLGSVAEENPSLN